MNCPNCGQPYEPGATVCLACGSPFPSTAAPSISPAPVYLAPLPDEVRPASSSVAKASLVLGIVGIVLIALVVILLSSLVGSITGLNLTSEAEITKFAEENVGRFTGVFVCLVGAELAALAGLILGIVGLSQEKGRPTQGGRTLSIIGTVLSALPLLCCVCYFGFGLIGVAGAR